MITLRKKSCPVLTRQSLYDTFNALDQMPFKCLAQNPVRGGIQQRYAFRAVLGIIWSFFIIGKITYSIERNIKNH